MSERTRHSFQGPSTPHTGARRSAPPSLEELAERTNLTNSQLLLWTGQQLHPEAPLYNMVLAFTLEGAVDPAYFQQAFQALVDGSDALRTVIEARHGVPQRRVLPSHPHLVEQVDLAAAPDPQAARRAWTRKRAGRRFDLSQPLFDTALLKVADDRYIWYLNQHHLITDAWSTALVYRHMADLYARSLNGTLGEAVPLPGYEAYAAYERSFRKAPLFQKTRAYWQRKLNGSHEPVVLYGKKAARETTRTRRLTRDLGDERSRRLRTLAAEKDVRALTEDLSLFNVFATVLFAYLHRVSGQRRLAFGTPSHNRPTAALKETMGVFIEVFPFQVEVGEDETFLSLLGKVKRETHAFLRYAQPGTSSSGLHHGFNVVLNYIHASFGPFHGLPMQSEWVHAGHGDPRHHLRLQVHDFDEAGRFQLHFDFNSDLFNASERRAAVDHFLRLLDGFIANRTQPLRQARLLSGKEKRRILTELGREPTTYDAAESVVALFEKQVARTPEATAVACGGRELTYRALNARANQLARYLRARGVGAEVLVGLYTRRSVEAVIAILGVLKAGGAYVPVDPSYPPERIAFILEDAQASILLTQRALAAGLSAQQVQTICLDADREGITSEPESNLSNKLCKNDLAYIIYTSGSTGQPKGVMVEHGAQAHYAAWAKAYYGRGDALSFPLFTPLTFDLTVTSIFTPLVSGGCVVVYEETDTRADLALLRVIEDDAVDVVKLTPSHLVLVQGWDLSSTRIKTLILGGEALTTELAAAVTRAFGGHVTIYNEYGPTEATVGCIVHRFDPEADTDATVPIGRPAAQAQVYLLDAERKPVPPGVVGEIYVGGPGLARGYLHQPERTQARFLPHPFRPGERVYRTGDLGCWQPGGTVQYLGRTDRQVKIRGVRIEPAEVEAALLRHPAIDACVVKVASPARREHAAFYCTRCGLPSNYPDASFDADGVCNLCRSFDAYAEKARRYFGSMDDLRSRLEQCRRHKRGAYDGLMLLSGGKDSTYALYQLAGMGFEVLAFTLDNGYISDEAKANIRRVTQALGVDHVFATTPAMNAIFVDSLKRHSNVCNGCFKTLYTLALKHARVEGIPCIVTGLSRGQFFETRLTEELFWNDSVDADGIDHIILEARKAYHRVDDAVYRLLDVDELQDGTVFDEVRFIDFYRYCDVELSEMLAFLGEHAPWLRPSDTGRSTNCLINEVGIYLHKKQRGYHNYAFPYSWDVRMGHKSRADALEELDDDIDPASVQRILDEIGYTEDVARDTSADDRLAAYYVSTAPIAVSELRDALGRTLPEHLIPTHFVRLDHLPLTPNGKIDRAALPDPEAHRPELETPFVLPRTPAEKQLGGVWAEVLRVDPVGIHDNFFDLGGDSIMAIQISARATAAGLPLAPGQLFEHQTVAALAAAVGTAPSVRAEQGLVTGPAPLTPIQHWFFDQDFFDQDAPDVHHFNQHGLFEVTEPLQPERLAQAFEQLVRQHDALRLRFTPASSGWTQRHAETATPPPVQHVDLSPLSGDDERREVHRVEVALQSRLDITSGLLMQAAYLERRPDQTDLLLIVIHHLAVDGVSWRILLEDLEMAYRQLAQGKPVRLPPKTTAYKAWGERLVQHAQSEALRAELEYWRTLEGAGRLSIDEAPGKVPTEASTCVLTVTLTAAETDTLLRGTPSAYRARIDEVLLAALASSLAARGPKASVRVDVEGHGREPFADDVDVTRTVGWFTALYPVALPLESAPAHALLKVKEHLRRLPGHGLDYGLLRYLCKDPGVAERMAAAPPSDVLFNYLGRLDQLTPASSLFRPARPLGLSRSPRMRRRYLLEVNAFVANGWLQVDWSYSPAVHREATIRQMADAYAGALRTLIARPHAPGTTTATPADFPLARLDDQKLGKLSDILRKADNAPPA